MSLELDKIEEDDHVLVLSISVEPMDKPLCPDCDSVLIRNAPEGSTWGTWDCPKSPKECDVIEILRDRKGNFKQVKRRARARKEKRK